MKTKNKNGDQQFLEIKNEKAQKCFQTNLFRKCFDKNKKVKTKNKMATKTFLTKQKS